MNNKVRLLLIDRICDQFEEQLQQGSTVDIQQTIDSAKLEFTDAETANELFLELISLQIVYSDDRDSAAASLKSKYPEKSELIDSAIQQRSLLGTINQAGVQTKIDLAGRVNRTHSISRVGDRFENLEHFASGGLGDVYVGYDKAVQRRVAVKLLKPEFVTHPEAKRRFLNEGAITGMLEHPAIVPVHDSGITGDGQPYYVMRLLEGHTLKAAIDELHARESASKKPPEQNVDQQQLRLLLRRLIQVCDAVAFAHDQGVIHRDLKPANVVLGKYGEAIVIDWGLAKRESAANSETENQRGNEPTEFKDGSSQDSSAPKNDLPPDDGTKIGNVLGTPEYMSPEQAAGDWTNVDSRSDVYSLGAIMYCVLTGVSPHGRNAIATQLRIDAAKQANFKTAKERNAAIPTALSAICERAMNVDPASRYESPSALAADIGNWLSDQPITARPDNALEKFSRFLRSYPRWSALAAATLVAITVGSTVATSVIRSQSTQLEKRKTEAESLAQKEAESFEVALGMNQELVGYVDILRDAFDELRADNVHKSKSSKNARLTDLVDGLESNLESTEELSQFTKWRILGNIVTVLNAAGEEQRALEKTRQYLNLTIELFGDEPLIDVIDAKAAFVYSLVRNSKYEEALALAEETLATLETTEIRTASKLGEMVRSKYEDALPGSEPKLSKTQATVVEVSASLLEKIKVSLLNSKLECLKQLHHLARKDEVVAIREQLDPWVKTVTPESLPNTLDELRKVGQYIAELSEVRNVPRLIEWQQKIYDAKKQLGGVKDPAALAGLYRLSQAIRKKKGPAASLPYQKDLVGLTTEVLGAEHRNTLTSKSNLALAHKALGQYSESIKHYLELRESWLKIDDQVNALACTSKIGVCQLHLGLRQDALKTFRGSIEQINKHDELLGPKLGDAKYQLAIALIENDQLDSAIAVLSETIESERSRENPAASIGYFVNIQFAHLLNGDFESALSERETIPVKFHNFPILMLQHARTMSGLERYDEAKEVLEKLLTLSASDSEPPAIVDATNLQIATGKGLLAGLIAKSDPTRAETLYLEAIAELENGFRFVKGQHSRIRLPLREFRAELVEFYEQAGNAKQADVWRKKLADQTQD